MHQADEPVIDIISSSEKKNGDYVKITFVVSTNIMLARRVTCRYIVPDTNDLMLNADFSSPSIQARP
jgi:hypothetical protein